MKNALYWFTENLILAVFDNKLFIKGKRVKPSLLSLNVVWFTNCSWTEQMLAFKYIDQYHAYNI